MKRLFAQMVISFCEVLSLHPNPVDLHLLASGACEWIGSDSIFRWVPSKLQLVCVSAKIANCPQALHLRQDFLLLQYQPESSTQSCWQNLANTLPTRLVFSSLGKRPQTVWGSGRIKYDNIEGDDDDDDDGDGDDDG